MPKYYLFLAKNQNAPNTSVGSYIKGDQIPLGEKAERRFIETKAAAVELLNGFQKFNDSQKPANWDLDWDELEAAEEDSDEEGVVVGSDEEGSGEKSYELRRRRRPRRHRRRRRPRRHRRRRKPKRLRRRRKPKDSGQEEKEMVLLFCCCLSPVPGLLQEQRFVPFRRAQKRGREGDGAAAALLLPVPVPGPLQERGCPVATQKRGREGDGAAAASSLGARKLKELKLRKVSAEKREKWTPPQRRQRVERTHEAADLTDSDGDDKPPENVDGGPGGGGRY